MTTNEMPPPAPLTPPIMRAINRLAISANALAMRDDDTDPFDLILAIADEFMLQFDLCPLHRCDIEICMDDEITECADLRARAGYGSSPTE
jgi:hypothetical protein